MAEDPERTLHSAKEAAKWLGIPVTTLYSWALRGMIPHYKVHKRVLFAKAELVPWLEKYHRSGDGPRGENLGHSSMGK